MKILLFYFLIAVTININAKTKSTCEVKASKNIVYGAAKPDTVGFCGWHAARNLLYQTICRADRKNCHLPSVLELLKISKKMKIKSIPRLLTILERGGVILTEDCVPQEELFKASTNEKKDWNNAFNDASNLLFQNTMICNSDINSKADFKDSCVLNQKSQYYQEVKELLQTDKDAWGFLFIQKVEEFIKNRVQNNRDICKHIKFQKFSHKEKKISKIEDLNNLLDLGTEVLVNLFIKQPNSQQKGPHAVVIANYKKTYCYGMCLTSYQIIDSLQLYWAGGESTSTWVSGKTLWKVIKKSSVSYLLPKK